MRFVRSRKANHGSVAQAFQIAGRAHEHSREERFTLSSGFLRIPPLPHAFHNAFHNTSMVAQSVYITGIVGH